MKDQIPQLEPTAEGFRVRLRYGAGQQGRFTVRVRDEVEAGRRAQLLRTLAADLVKSGRRPVEAKVILQTLGEATGADEFSALLAVAGASAKKGKGGPARAVTSFSDVADEWTSGRLHQKFPDHVKAKRTAEDDEQLLRVLCKTVGQVPIDRFELEHAEIAMSKLPEGLSSARRRHYAQVLARVLKLAVYPMRLITASPLPTGFLPKVSSNKAKGWLYPSEDKALMGKTEIPLGRRLLWGFLSREGVRLGEAMALRWEDVDLKRGTITLDENKTDDPRFWALGQDVARALELFRPTGAESTDLVFPQFKDVRRAAEILRDDLVFSGVTRTELFKATKSRSALRVHDLRGTFVTLALANGRTETWVSDRTGHRSSQMIHRYRRAARSATELRLGWLTALDQALPETRSENGNTAQGESEGESKAHLTDEPKGPKSTKPIEKAGVAEWQTQRIQNPPP